MVNLCLPADQLFKYHLTGKFVAPDEGWKHGLFPLTEYELIVMTSGTLYLEYGEYKFTVFEGEYLFLPPSDAFRKGFKEAYSSFYWLHFTFEPHELPEKVTVMSQIKAAPGSFWTIPQCGKIPKPDKMVILMKQLQDLVKEKYPASCLNAMSTAIVAELCGQLTLAASPLNNSVQKQVYQDILDYIEDNIDCPMLIGDVAKHFGYNEKYLSHRFTEISGIPLKQFILKQKMEKANCMLTDSNLSVVEIAHELGFSDGHNFCRAYKKVTGLSPSEYRNAYSKRLLFHK